MAKVLIVDDFKDNIFLLEEVLDILDLECFSVNNGKEAVDEVQRNTYDIVLMDIEMPVMNGFEAAEEIRELSAPLCSIPIVAISAHNHDFFADRIGRSGINDFVSKPYTVVKMEQVMQKFGII